MSIIKVDFNKKARRTDARGRPESLGISHQQGTITTPERGVSNEEFSDRISRIRHSLERINKLMRELRDTDAGRSAEIKDEPASK